MLVRFSLVQKPCSVVYCIYLYVPQTPETLPSVHVLNCPGLDSYMPSSHLSAIWTQGGKGTPMPSEGPDPVDLPITQ